VVNQYRDGGTTMIMEAPTYRCFLCGSRINPELCEGRYIQAWKVTVCANCLSSNRSGIRPSRAMLAKFEAARLSLKLNKLGKIDWPEPIDKLILPADRVPRQPIRPRRAFVWKDR
jgi:hypothetical protein